MFDPCGTRRLDGDEILKRIAESLGVGKDALIAALKSIQGGK
jgi:RIO-like serine/threonine protein kinase